MNEMVLNTDVVQVKEQKDKIEFRKNKNQFFKILVIII